jgi:DHA2 family multidrug resistance protein
MWLLITCTLVTTLYATTITIANVSLPQIQGALSASPDQVAWVVTSNLIATAVTIPLAGWISGRFGRRRCMLWGVLGFGLATLMCGLSTSLSELIFWRVVQSAFGSPLTPIAQSVVIDSFSAEKRAKAVAIFTMGVGVVPTIAPMIGGYISAEISWRWIFFILIPIAVMAFIGVLTFIKADPPRQARAKLDWTGFLSLSIFIACIQLMLDRGETQGWFGSLEIILEAIGAIICGWIFIAHSFTSDQPFIDLRLLKERNFVIGIGISAIFGMLFVTPMVLMPAMLQQLRDVPEFTVGFLIGIRGFGTAVAQILVIMFANRWDPRLMLLIGFGVHTIAGVEMSGFGMDVSLGTVAWTMAFQGFGVGFLWLPMTLVIVSNFDPKRTPEGMAMFHFVRSVASSFYISASFIVIFHTQKMSYSELVQMINLFTERLNLALAGTGWGAEMPANMAVVSSEIARQATNIGYINVYNLFLWTSMLVYPLILMIAWPPKGFKPDR